MPETSSSSSELNPEASTPIELAAASSYAKSSEMERELQEQEDETVRKENAYPGATNSIGSIHQRKWFISFDRASSGFEPQKDAFGKRIWVRKCEDGKLTGSDRFFVQGRDVETSVVTGRTAAEVMSDEGVEEYVGRKGWRAVME